MQLVLQTYWGRNKSVAALTEHSSRKPVFHHTDSTHPDTEAASRRTNDSSSHLSDASWSQKTLRSEQGAPPWELLHPRSCTLQVEQLLEMAARQRVQTESLMK